MTYPQAGLGFDVFLLKISQNALGTFYKNPVLTMYHIFTIKNSRLGNRNIDQVILAFLQGEATTNEVEILRKWMSDDKEHQDIFESIKLYWDNSTPGVKSLDTDKAYDRLTANFFEGSSKDIININTNYRSTFSWYKIAVALIIFFTLGAGVFYVNNSNREAPKTIVITEIIKQNPKGQKLTTYLPDGSKVILNSLSRIKYKTPFIAKERIVELDGEAFFEIIKDTLKPFKVVSHGVTTTALGTSFNVNCKSNDHVEIVLIAGKVRVTNASRKSVILNPGKSAIASESGKLQIKDFDYTDKVGWKDGVLVFKNNTLPEIITKLEDWYGVEFIVDTKLTGSFHFSGNYNNETLEDVLQGISFVHNFEYKILGDTVKIYYKQKNI